MKDFLISLLSVSSSLGLLIVIIYMRRNMARERLMLEKFISDRGEIISMLERALRRQVRDPKSQPTPDVALYFFLKNAFEKENQKPMADNVVNIKKD